MGGDVNCIQPHQIKIGNYCIYKDGGFNLMMQANLEVISQINEGSQKYFPVPITEQILKGVNAEKLNETTYQLFLIFTYNLQTKELRHENTKVCDINYLHQIQDLYTLLSENKLTVKI